MQKLFLIFILSGFIVHSFSQELNYPVKIIDGKEYYVYKVELQEGLYSISKKFGVKQADIISLNPEAENGLKNGQKLIIPKQTTTVKAHKSVVYTPQNVIYHVVEKKQTLFSISRKYNVPIDSIVKYNPRLENGLQTGDTLLIPDATEPKKNIIELIFGKKDEKVEVPENTKSSQEQNYIIHKVEAKETLYSISKFYNVEIADIIALNPDAEISLKTGMDLKIPSAKTVAATNTINKESKAETAENTIKHINNRETLRIAYLLPFMLDQNSDVSNDRFVDFYAGSLLAIKEAKSQGISLEISTFDTEKSENSMYEILDNPLLKKADLIIGPAYTNQLSSISEFALNNHILTLIPFSSKIYDIYTNQYLIQFNPGINESVKCIAEFLKSKYRNSNIIFAENVDAYNADDGKTFCDLLRSELNNQKRKYKTIGFINDEQPDFLNVLDKTEKNIIFFNTDKFSHVNKFLLWLGSSSNGMEISYYKHTGWSDTENQMLKSISLSPLKDRYDNSNLNNYKQKFQQNFHRSDTETNPSYDLLGYDLTGYFIKLLSEKGANYLIESEKLPSGTGIQSNFIFQRNSHSSGLINKQLYLTEK